MNPILTILHPTDYSDSANHAFRLACSLARDSAARLVILHATPPPYPLVGEAIAIPPSAFDIAETNRLLNESLTAIKPNVDGILVEHRLEEDDPIAAILRVAEEVDADLIVMGTHGRTGIERLLMGSIAEQIVRKAGCSVLTVKSSAGRRAERVASKERRMPVAV